MDLTRLRLWQWMIIGLLAGAAVGFAWSNLPNDLQRTGNVNQFRALVRAAPNATTRGQPAPIRNITVHEPELDPSNVLVYPVTFEYIEPAARRDWRRQLTNGLASAANTPGAKPAAPAAEAPKYAQSGIYATTPFEGKESIIDYLNTQKMPFANRTGAMQYMPLYFGAASGLVLIGIVWPGIIQGLIAAKFVTPRPVEPKKPKEPKHRTGEDVDDMITKAVAKPVDAGALDKLNDAMEANLGATLTSGGPRAAKLEAEEPVSILMSGGGSRSTSDPMEKPAAPMTPEEKKDFAGVYYPVARTVKKDDEATPGGH